MSSLTSSLAKSPRRLLLLVLVIFALLICLAMTGERKSNAKGSNVRPSAQGLSAEVNLLPLHGFQSSTPEQPDFGVLWKDEADANLPARPHSQQKLKAYRVLELNRIELTRALAQAPMEFSEDAVQSKAVITLAAPDGTDRRFSIQESPVMSPELAASFPEIKTYSGQDLDDPTATMRLSLTPRGLNAFVIGARDSFMVTPYSETDAVHYMSYFTRDVEGASFECFVPGADKDSASVLSAPDMSNLYTGDALTIANGTLREYRISFSVTQQFYQHFGGPTISPANDTGVVAAIAAYVNSVNTIYEREVATRFKFNSWIADRPGFCFAAFNCFPPDQNVNQMLQPNQFLLDTVFPGAANYDIGAALGYDFAPLPGGVSSFGSGGSFNGVGGACENSFKGQSATLLVGTAGDYIGTVILAHEWGHMFGARHTFSSTFCSATQLDQIQNRVEPGSGSTIMSYAPTCPPENLFTGNPSSGPDNYFHVHSLLKIINHKSIYSACGQSIATNNAPPTITNGGSSATIPNLTPFTLTAAATDPNGDALTYDWEEWDPGATLFRSYRPSTSPSRTFPSPTYILNNGNVPPLFVNNFFSGEALPAGSGSLFFTVTVRDNRAGGGGVTARDTLLQVNVVGAAGPFKVTFPNAQTTLPSGPITVFWNVAGTNLAPIGTSSVRILLSTDGGNTFPTVLAANTPNDGSETVTLPATQTTTARIKVEAVGNIYFDISDANFGISSATPNLTPFQPTGWSDKIVVSNASGTTSDSSPLRTTDTLFVDWAVLNNGSAATGATFFTKLFVDGTERAFWFSDPPLSVNFYSFVSDFNLGSLSAGTHTIKIVTDTSGVIPESNEADNEYTKTITVVQPPTVQFSSAAYTAGEGTGLATVTVTRSGATSSSASVNYATSDAAGLNNCATLSGAASSRCDYITTVGTLTFAPNETSKTISVPLVNDSYVEGPESLTLTLRDPSGVGLGSPGAATLTIVDNDTVAGANPIVQPSFFVGEHYFDFLNRNADAAGLTFWTNEITSCGSNQTCVEIKRINVSAAFFQSIEFQNTGYLVYRTYKAAYGDATSLNVPGTVPVIRLSEFLPDTQRIGQGVIVGQGAWQTQLEANKQAYMLEFIQRQRFLDAYPLSMTPAQFVDKLRLNTGAALSQAERDQLVSQLTSNNTSAGRAAVLRSVAEDADLQRNELNRAFVLMQYYGYLRRDPDAAPDSDFRGWKFWLDKLNQFGGNFVNAEMVKAFITSNEYRARFGAN